MTSGIDINASDIIIIIIKGKVFFSAGTDIPEHRLCSMFEYPTDITFSYYLILFSSLSYILYNITRDIHTTLYTLSVSSMSNYLHTYALFNSILTQNRR